MQLTPQRREISPAMAWARSDLGSSQFRRTMKLLKRPDDPFLRFPVVLPGNAGDAAVSGDDDADGGVLPDDLPGTGLRRLRHGDLMVKPGGGHHPGGIPLQLAHGPGHHVAHTVDEPNGEGRTSLQRHVGGLLRHELGLRRHDGAAGAALGQLIPGPLPAVDVVDVGDDLRLHETLDEGGCKCRPPSVWRCSDRWMCLS